jgi:hypothetical protein
MVAIHVALCWILKDRVKEGYSDFAIFYTAGTILHQGLGNKLYDYQTQWNVQRSFAPNVAIRQGPLPYNHPPFEALLFAPLAHFPYFTAFIVWDAFNLGVLLVLALLLREYLPGEHRLAMAILVLIGFFPICVTLMEGQDSILLLLLYVLAFLSLKHNAKFMTGAFLGLGLFKFHLVLPLVAVLALRRQGRVLCGFVVAAVGLIASSITAIGWAATLDYPQYLWALNRSRAMGVIVPGDMPNLRGLLDIFGGRFPTYVDVTIGLVSTVLILTAVNRWRVLSPQLISKNRERALDLAFSFTLVVTLMTSYHVYVYDTGLLILPIFLIARSLHEFNDLPPTVRTLLVVAIAVLFFTPLWIVLWFHFNQLNLMSFAMLLFGAGIFGAISAIRKETTRHAPVATV